MGTGVIVGVISAVVLVCAGYLEGGSAGEGVVAGGRMAVIIAVVVSCL